MIAALGTLVFLTTLWLMVVVGAAVLEESGTKIAAALKGKPAQPLPLCFAPVRLRTRARFGEPSRAIAKWRPAGRAAA
jgi:hypothetical protein